MTVLINLKPVNGYNLGLPRGISLKDLTATHLMEE